MELTILGAHQGMLPLLERIQGIPGSVRAWQGTEDVAARLRRLFPQAKEVQIGEVRSTSRRGTDGPHRASAFSGLDLGSSLLLVGGGIPYLWDEPLREWAQRGIPLILEMPPCSGILALELDLIQQDTGAVLVPLHLPSLYPGWQSLAACIQEPGQVAIPQVDVESLRGNGLGSVERIEWVRWSPVRSIPAVRTMLAQDGLILRQLLGRFLQINAIAPGLARTPLPQDIVDSQDLRLSQLDVRISGPRNVLAHWRIEKDGARAGIELTVVGENGRLVLDLPDSGPWCVRETISGGAHSTAQVNSLTTSERLLSWTEEDQRASLSQYFEQIVTTGEAQKKSWPNWEDACRSLELVDLAEESARRGKSLTVFNERLTEQDTFHGMMAAGGCLLLVGMLGLVLAITLVDAFRLPLRHWEVWRNWPVALLAVLGSFLLLQLLKLAYRK